MYTLWRHAFNWATRDGMGHDEATAYADWFAREYPNGDGLTASTSHLTEYARFVRMVTA